MSNEKVVAAPTFGTAMTALSATPELLPPPLLPPPLLQPASSAVAYAIVPRVPYVFIFPPWAIRFLRMSFGPTTLPVEGNKTVGREDRQSNERRTRRPNRRTLTVR